MTRREEIEQQAEMFRQPYRGSGNYSTSMDIKNAFQAGAKWADKTMIERACEWLYRNWREYIYQDGDGEIHFGHWESDFRKAMEEE